MEDTNFIENETFPEESNSSSGLHGISEYKDIFKSINEVLLQPLPEVSEVADILKNVIEQCSHCVDYGLKMIQESNDIINIDMQFINDLVTLTSNLRSFLDNAQGSLILNCEELPTLPVTIGSVLFKLFNYCKESELIYGYDINKLQKPLKDLFQCCNNLHLTYLYIIEKSFVFDLEEEAQLEILIEVLNINVLIGEVVTDLNVKTMAEHWKGFSAVCEKYCDGLGGKFELNELTSILSGVIVKNLEDVVKTKMQNSALNKILKITGFIQRVLGKIYSTFSLSLPNDITNIATTLCVVYGYSDYYLIHLGMSEELAEKIKLIIDGAEPLVLQLAEHNNFAKALFELQFEENDIKNLGLIVLLSRIIISILSTQNNQLRSNFLSNSEHSNIVCRTIEHISQCSKWLNSGIEVELVLKKSQKPLSVTLYEYLLIHTAALSLTVDHEVYATIESSLVHSLLGTELSKAVFASDLWIILARYSPTSLTVDHIEYLINTLETLKNSNVFYGRPQSVYLSSILHRLFNILDEEDQLKVLKKYPVLEYKEVWIAIQLNSLPECSKKEILLSTWQDLNKSLEKIFDTKIPSTGEFQQLIDLLNLCATSGQNKLFSSEIVMSLWHAVSSTESMVKQESIQSNQWYNELVLTVSKFTEMQLYMFDSDSICEVLGILHKLIQHSNSNIKLATLSLIFHLSFKEYSDYVYCKIGEVLAYLMTHEEVKENAFRTFESFCKHAPNDQVLRKITLAHDLKEQLISYLKADTFVNVDADFKFKHKCNIDGNRQSEESLKDFVDIDGIFEEDENASKKPKVVNEEIEQLLSGLQANAVRLKLHHKDINFESQTKIKHVCDILNELI